MRRVLAVAAVSVAALLTSGCLFQVATGSAPWPPTGGTPLVSGTVTGTPITGTYAAVVTSAGPSTDPNCVGGPVELLVTLTDAAGNTVTKQETGQLCSTGSALQFTGEYTVTGGSGPYEGATGSGTSTIQIIPDPFVPFPRRVTFTAVEIGTFQLPGTASAANTRKRTFKSHGTVSAAKLCAGSERDPRISKSRRCTKLGAWDLRQAAGLAIGTR